MTHDELEFLISQHFDGTLSAAEAEKLRAVLDADASARALFDEHAALDAALKSSRIDTGIDQDWLSAQIAGTIDEAQSKPLRVAGWSIFAPMAMAACLLIGLTLGVVFLKDSTETSLPTPTVARTIEVGPAETDRPVAVASVSVGVPANLTPALMTALFVSDQRTTGKVIIKPAGEYRHGPFD